MYRFVLALGLLAACGSKQNNNGGRNIDAGNGGGSSVDGGTTDTGNDGGSSLCQTACWTAADRPLTLPPRTAPLVTNVDYPVCNEVGVGPDSCPTGFACTGTDSTPLDKTHFFTRKVCVPTSAALPPFLVDIGQPHGVAVHFDFTLNGGAWPTSATPGAAGRIVFSPRRYGASVTRTMPTQAGGLDVTLSPGTYDVALLMFSTYDITRYPSVPLRGTLEVIAAGTVHLDLAGQAVPVALRFDDTALPTLVSGDRVTLTFTGYHGQDVSITQTSGALPTSIMLEPDSYQVTIESDTSNATSTLPAGKIVVEDPLQVKAGATASYNVPTYRVSGAVTLDNAALPANATSYVSFGGRNAVRLDAQSRYQARLLAGTYDVVFAGACPSGSSGAVRVLQQFTAATTTLDLQVSSVPYNGTVTIDFAAPPGASSRGLLLLNVPGSSLAPQVVPLAPTGAATWNQRVFAGTYQVTLHGEHGLPQYAVFDSSATITAPTTKTYNLAVGGAVITLLNNGAQLADGTTTRGSVLIRSTDPTVPPTSVSASNTGPWQGTAVLLPGAYTVEYDNDSSYPGLPAGRAALATINVMADVTSPLTYDVHPVSVVGELRRNGLPLASPATIFFGGQSVTVPVSVPTTISANVLPGVLDLIFQCDACGESGDSVSQYLLYGIHYR